MTVIEQAQSQVPDAPQANQMAQFQAFMDAGMIGMVSWTADGKNKRLSIQRMVEPNAYGLAVYSHLGLLESAEIVTLDQFVARLATGEITSDWDFYMSEDEMA